MASFADWPVSRIGQFPAPPRGSATRTDPLRNEPIRIDPIRGGAGRVVSRYGSTRYEQSGADRPVSRTWPGARIGQFRGLASFPDSGRRIDPMRIGPATEPTAPRRPPPRSSSAPEPPAGATGFRSAPRRAPLRNDHPWIAARGSPLPDTGRGRPPRRRDRTPPRRTPPVEPGRPPSPAGRRPPPTTTTAASRRPRAAAAAVRASRASLPPDTTRRPASGSAPPGARSRARPHSRAAPAAASPGAS